MYFCQKNIFMRLVFIFFWVFSSATFAQDLEKSPKKITLETGYTYIRKTSFNDISRNGFALAFDYGWQVGGFKNKPAAYISIPLGYIAIPPIKEGTKNSGISYYGVHITHNLKKIKNITPFFGYSLMFNQFRIQDTPGRVIGHETKFDTGVNLGKKIFLKAEYSIGSFPALGKKDTDKIGTAGFKIGYIFK